MKWFLSGLLCVLPGMTYELCKRLYYPSKADIYRYRGRIKGRVDLEDPKIIEFLENGQNYGGGYISKAMTGKYRNNDISEPFLVQSMNIS